MKLELYSLNEPNSDIKRYIGISVNSKRRYLQHLRESKCNLNKQLWIKDLKSKGELPELVIMESNEDYNYILNQEKKLIAETPNLLNISKGGEWNYCNSPINKFIDMYSLDGEYINTFDSEANAARAIELSPDKASGISATCRRIRNYAYGYIWRYSEDLITIEDLKRLHRSLNNTRNSVQVLQYDVYGNLIESYKSIELCAVSTGNSKGNIMAQLRGITTNAKGYIYAYSESDFLEKFERFKLENCSGICMYNDTTTLYFKSATHVASYFNLQCQNTIKRCLENPDKSYKGYKFVKRNNIDPALFYTKEKEEVKMYYKDGGYFASIFTEGCIRSRLLQYIREHENIDPTEIEVEISGKTYLLNQYLDSYKKKDSSIQVTCIENGKTYSSYKEAADDLKISSSLLSLYKKGKIKNPKYTFIEAQSLSNLTYNTTEYR